MMIAYVFTHKAQIAVTGRLDGSNLPPLGKGVGVEWQALRRVDDVNECGVVGFDRDGFDRQGYRSCLGLRPSPRGSRTHGL
jgi:hypothetical protein